MKRRFACIVTVLLIGCFGLVEGGPSGDAPLLDELRSKFIEVVEAIYDGRESGSVLTKDTLYRRGALMLHPDKGGGADYVFDRWFGLIQSPDAPSSLTREEALKWIEKSVDSALASEEESQLNNHIRRCLIDIYLAGNILFPLPGLNLELMAFFDEMDHRVMESTENIRSLKEARVLTRRLSQKINEKGRQNVWLGSIEQALDVFTELCGEILLSDDELDLPLVLAVDFRGGVCALDEGSRISSGAGFLGALTLKFYHNPIEGDCYSAAIGHIVDMFVDKLLLTNSRRSNKWADAIEQAAEMARYICKVVQDRGDSAKEADEFEALEYFGTILAERYNKEWRTRPKPAVAGKFLTPESIFLTTKPLSLPDLVMLPADEVALPEEQVLGLMEDSAPASVTAPAPTQGSDPAAVGAGPAQKQPKVSGAKHEKRAGKPKENAHPLFTSLPRALTPELVTALVPASSESIVLTTKPLALPGLVMAPAGEAAMPEEQVLELVEDGAPASVTAPASARGNDSVAAGVGPVQEQQKILGSKHKKKAGKSKEGARRPASSMPRALTPEPVVGPIVVPAPPPPLDNTASSSRKIKKSKGKARDKTGPIPRPVGEQEPAPVLGKVVPKSVAEAVVEVPLAPVLEHASNADYSPPSLQAARAMSPLREKTPEQEVGEDNMPPVTLPVQQQTPLIVEPSIVAPVLSLDDGSTAAVALPEQKNSLLTKSFFAAGLASGVLFYYVRKAEVQATQRLRMLENNPLAAPDEIATLRAQKKSLQRYKLLTLIPFLSGLSAGAIKVLRG